MKSGCLIRAYHDMETQRKGKRNLTGNQESISVIISTERCDIMEVTMVAMSSEVRDAILRFQISFLPNRYSVTV